MSYLPYGDNRSGTWAASAVVSFGLHAALIVALSSNLSQFVFEPRQDPARPEMQVSLQQVQTDQLADLEDRLGDLDDLPPPSEFDAFAPEEAEPPNDVDTFEAEAPDTLEAETAPDLDALDAVDAVEPTAPDSVDEVAPIAPDPQATVEAPDLDVPVAEPTVDATEPDAVEAALPDALDPADIEPVAPTPDIAEAQPTDAPDAVPPTVLPEDLAAADDLTAADLADAVAPAPSDDPATLAEPVLDEAAQTPDIEGSPDAVALADAVQPNVVDDLSVPLPEAGDQPVIAGASPLFSEDGSGAAVPLDAADLDTGIAPLPQLAQDLPEPVALAATPAIPPPVLADDPPPETAVDTVPPVDAVGPEQVAILSLPEPVSPVPTVTPEPDQQAALAAPPLGALEPVTPDDSVATVAVTPPAAPRVVRRVPRAPPSARDRTVAELIHRIRRAPTPTCLVALPRRIGTEGIGLTLISAQDETRTDFSATVLTRQEDQDIRQTPLLIDQRQCPALQFVAANRDYPATRIGIQIERVEVPSGNRLSGTLSNVGQRELALMLVDNNGVVQSLDRFVSARDGTVRFDIPVTRVGPRRDTKQLLLAVAADTPLTPLTQRSGESATDVFDNLNAALVRDAAFALLAFDVR